MHNHRSYNMSIILELRDEFVSIIEHTDSDNLFEPMYEAAVQIVADQDISPEDFVDEYEYHEFIENLMDQAERSVKIEFIPTMKLIGLVCYLNDKAKEKKGV